MRREVLRKAECDRRGLERTKGQVPFPANFCSADGVQPCLVAIPHLQYDPDSLVPLSAIGLPAERLHRHHHSQHWRIARDVIQGLCRCT